MAAAERPRVVGHCDAIQGKEIHGWAWHPERPDEPVRVELVIDDRVIATTEANRFRGDLRKAGIGHGRYGWRLPFLPPARPGPLRVIVRAEHGEPLIGGAFDHHREPPPEDAANPIYRAFVAAVLDPAQTSASTPEPSSASAIAAPGATPRIHFLIHSAAGDAVSALGSPDYSYGFVVRAYLPVLRSLGTVHMLDDDAAATDALHAQIRGRGESAILLSFAPPHHTPIGLPAPPVPVIAWEFPTIPNREWQGDIRNDWRHVLRQTGRIIVASSHSVAAIRAEMGAAFPVIAIPTPIFDRLTAFPPAPAPGTPSEVTTDGFVFDSRAVRMMADDGFAPPPARDGRTAQISGCDLYYKRSYYPPNLTTLPPHLRSRVRSFGLNYASRGRVSTVLLPVLRDYALRLARAAIQNPRQLRDEVQQVQLRGFLRSPLISDFERAPATNSGQMQILFQTRLWPQVGAGESLDEINHQRICLTRTLKKEFPKQFRGGLMPDDFSRHHCPDLVSHEPAGRRQYISWSKACEIGVYSRGLHHSQAFKLGEYFASSKCIVMDPMRNQLPTALVKGENYLQFDSPTDCAAHCETLLTDSPRALAMQESNWAYYRAEVSPASRMKRLLQDVSSSMEVVSEPDLSTKAF